LIEHRLEPYRGADILEFLRVVTKLELLIWRDGRSSEDEFEVYARWYGDAAIGVRLEERSGIDPRTGYVNQERTRAVVYGVHDLELTLETVDGVIEGSFVSLRINADAALEQAMLKAFRRTFSR
jgi:hypothetical protein